VQHSKIGRSTSGVGQKQRGPSEPVAGACPKCPESRHSSMMAADGSHGPAGSRGSGGRAQRGMGCDASISLSPVEAAWPRQAARAARWRVILGRRHLGTARPGRSLQRRPLRFFGRHLALAAARGPRRPSRDGWPAARGSAPERDGAAFRPEVARYRPVPDGFTSHPGGAARSLRAPAGAPA
jgi:hypothetical protein